MLIEQLLNRLGLKYLGHQNSMPGSLPFNFYLLGQRLKCEKILVSESSKMVKVIPTYHNKYTRVIFVNCCFLFTRSHIQIQRFCL